MQKTYTHELVYDFDNEATITEIAASLIANEKFVKDAFAVLQSCHPGLEIAHLKVRLSEVTQQSPLKEIITAAVVIGFQEDLEEEVPDFITAMTGINVSDKYESMITVLVVAVALYGLLALIERVFKGRSIAETGQPAIATKEAYSHVTNVAGDLIQVDGESIRHAITERVSGRRKKSTAKSTRDLLMPAKKHNARSIQTSSTVDISRAVIDEIPSEIDEQMFEPLMDEYEILGASVSLRAHDLDRNKAGWAGVVAEVSEKRVKIQKDPSIDAEILFTKLEVTADIRVYLQENDDGDMEPYLYIIHEIHDDDSVID